MEIDAGTPRGRLTFPVCLLAVLLVAYVGGTAFGFWIGGKEGIRPLAVAAGTAGMTAGVLIYYFYPALLWRGRCVAREDAGEAMAASFLWNTGGWVLVTSILKMSGVAISPPWMWGILCAGCVPAFFVSPKGVPVSGGGGRWAVLPAAAFFSLCAVPAIFPSYFSWGIDRYWVAAGNWINPIPPSQELGRWPFGGDDAAVSPVAISPAGPARGARSGRWTFTGEGMTLRAVNRTGRPVTAPLRLFFSGPFPSGLVLSGGGFFQERIVLYDALPDARPDFWVRNYHRFAWQREMLFPPGDTFVTIRAEPPVDPARPIVVEDYSGLDRTAFFSRATGQWLFCEVGALYDMLDTTDAAIYMRRRLFPYMSGLVDRRPGYTPVMFPMGIWLNMIASTPFPGDDFGAMRAAALAKTVILSLCLFLFYRYRNPGAGLCTGALLLIPLIAVTVNLVNYRLLMGEDQLFTIGLLLSLYWLDRGRPLEAVAACVMLMLTRLNGIQMLAFGFIAWGMASREWKRPLCLLAVVAVIYAVYWGAFFQIGRTLGCLPLWKAHIYDETWRFRFSGLTPASYVRNLGTLTWWVFLSSGGLAVVAFVWPDRISRALIIFTVVYFPLVAATRLLKVYYLVPLVLPLSIAACRNLAGLARSPSPVVRRGALVARFVMLLVGIACIAGLLKTPLVYPEFSARWPAWTFRD